MSDPRTKLGTQYDDPLWLAIFVGAAGTLALALLLGVLIVLLVEVLR